MRARVSVGQDLSATHAEMPKQIRHIKSIPAANRAAFTLVEALVALTLMMLAGAAILLSIDATLTTSQIAVEETIADGMARQLVDEVLGKRYMATHTSPYQTPLGHSGWEGQGNGRERFNDTDDFHGFNRSGPEDIWGNNLGQGDGAGGLRHPAMQVPTRFFANWRQRIEVYYVDPDDLSKRLSGNETSNYRAVEVTIDRRTADGAFLTLANSRRVFAYVPSL